LHAADEYFIIKHINKNFVRKHKMNINLYYQEKGDKEPFILLHGNGEDGSYFKNQMDYFSDRYRVIALDTRGHGRSPRGTEPFTIEQFSCDLYNFMTSLNISNAIILGFSDGANIAMKFAIKYPGKVKALILNGGNLNPKGVKRTVQIPIEIGYRIARLFASKSPNAKRNAEMLGLMVDEPNIGLDELSKITAPTLVICGSSDMIREAHTKEIAGNIPHAKLSIMKGNHFIANRRCETFNKEVENFLQTIQ
jgi:pimeloyl-ACP methyl ester carboxylesterase